MSHLRGVRCASSSRTCLRPWLFQRSRRGRFSRWWLDFPKAGKGSGNAPPNRRLAQGAAGPQGRTHQTGGCRAWAGEAPQPCPALGRKRRAGRSRAGGGSSVGRRVCPGRAQPGVAHTPRCRVNRPAPGPSPRWRNDHSRRGRERTGLPQHCRCPGAGWPRLRTGGVGRPWPPRRSYLSTSLGEQGRAAVGVPAHTHVFLRTRVVPHTRVLHMRPSVCPWHRSWGWGLEGEM